MLRDIPTPTRIMWSDGMSEDPYELLDSDFGEIRAYLVEVKGGFRAIKPVEDIEETERAFAESYGGG